MDTAVVYRRKEQVTIMGDRGLDYLVRDEEGKEYLVDKSYFRRHYETTPTLPEIPPNTELWNTLHHQAEDLHKVKRANTNLRNELKQERKENDKLRKQLGMKRKPHYRNGQKRGSHGRNG